MGFNPDLAETVNEAGKTPEGYAYAEQDHAGNRQSARARRRRVFMVIQSSHPCAGVKTISGGVVMG